MVDRERRRELREEFERIRPEAGVYLIRNGKSGRALLGSTRNLAALRNRVDFARRTGMHSALDLRLREETARDGIDAFSLEVLEILEVTPEMTETQMLADLGALEELWRERLDPETLY